jgi:hypothetical protein
LAPSGPDHDRAAEEDPLRKALALLLWLAVACSSQTHSTPPASDDVPGGGEAIPFELFASFERIEGNPIIALEPPLWAAATHAIVVDDTVNYYWSRRDRDRRWELMHSTAPVADPTDITHDPRNPIVLPSETGFDDTAVEYPFPFRNPFDGRYYMYYRGKGRDAPEQTGLLVSSGDMGSWARVVPTPVISADAEHERDGATDPHRLHLQGDAVLRGRPDHVPRHRTHRRPRLGHEGSGQPRLRRQRGGLGPPGGA